jgi:hypothetical protein
VVILLIGPMILDSNRLKKLEVSITTTCCYHGTTKVGLETSGL